MHSHFSTLSINTPFTNTAIIAHSRPQIHPFVLTRLHSPLQSKLTTRAAASSSSTSRKSKRPTLADLREKVQELEAENKALRAALAAIQGGDPSDDEEIEEPLLSYETDSDEEPIEPAYAPQKQLEGYGEAGSLNPMAAAARASMTPSVIISDLTKGIRWPQPGESPAFYERPARDAPLPVPYDDSAADEVYIMSQAPVHVVHVTAEMAPYAKVGGLGDVVTGLSKACIAQGHTTQVILPFYECLPESVVQNLKFDRAFDCPFKNQSTLRTLAYTGVIEGVPVILLRPDWEATGRNIFKGGRIYGGSYNETEAYLYFSRAALEYLVASDSRPDVIHAHEWQASAVPMLYWEAFSESIPDARPALTIHNMDNSGECRQDEFAATGVDGTIFADVNKALDERTIGHNPERLCLLKGGMVYSSIVTTVSPTYAMETLTGGAAGWLRSTLARPEIADKYWGVLNGIDTDMWNPATDPLLPACYSASLPEGKALCKRFLQQGLGMTVSAKRPLVAVISRLVPQKGIHLIEHSVGRTVSQNGQFVLLGTGHADGGLRHLANDVYNDNDDVHMVFGYSETLAHLIYAAADIFLVPSMFEPCGLTQMIALRYGAVPIVRSTGGLADTVRDVNSNDFEDEYQQHGGPPPNGFVFEGIDAGSLDSALDRALAMYKEQPDEWAALSSNNMKHSERWSWRAPARSYVELYSGMLERR